MFLQGQYPNNIWSIPWKVAPCPLKDCNVHFQMSNPPFKWTVPLLEESIFLHVYAILLTYSTPFKSAICLKLWALPYVQKMVDWRFKCAHSSNYNIFQEGGCLHQRVLFPKYGSLSWENITLCIQKNDVQLWRTYLTCLHVPCVLHSRKYSVKRALHVQEGSFLT